MTQDNREVKQGQLRQGVDELIARTIDTTAWSSSAPTVTGIVAYDITDGARTDVSATVLVGSSSVLGNVITLPLLWALTNGRTYRVEVKFTSGGNTFEPYMIVKAEL